MAKKTERKYVSATELRTMLRTKYAAPEYALFDEVGNGTGFNVNRHCDCLAMAIWPSRGLEIMGFELKVSRSDWLRELKNPKKAEEIAGYCDRWVIVAGSADIIKDGELPLTWGLSVASDGKLLTKVEAPKLEPKALDRSFVAAILRRAHGGQERIRDEAFTKGKALGIEVGPDRHKVDLHRVETERDDLKKSIGDFEKASGLKIDRYNGGNLGEVVQLIQRERRNYRTLDELSDPSGRLKAARTRLAEIVQFIDDDIEAESRIRGAITARKDPAA